MAAIAERDFDRARDELGHCIEAWPFGAQFHFLMAQTCRRMDDFKAWEAHLGRAHLLQWPEDQVLLESQLKEAQAGDLWQVEPVLLEALDDATPEDEVLIREALIKGYLENDHPRQAAEIANTWLDRWPNDWEAWLYRGRAFQQGTFFDKAIADYEQVLKLKPDEPHARLWMADTMLSLQQFEPAEQAYEAYVKMRPNVADALWGLAKCQYQLGHLEAAEATLDHLIRQAPDHEAGLLLRAKLVLSQDPAQAIKWLRKAEKLNPDGSDLLHNMVQALRQLHRNGEADAYQRRLDTRRPRMAQLQKLRMQLLKEAGNLDLRCDIAKLYLAIGEEEEAAHMFQTILYADPNHRPTLRALAEYWDKHDNPKRAAQYREKAGQAAAKGTHS